MITSRHEQQSQLLDAMNQFITDTSNYAAEQLSVLFMMESFVSPESYKTLDKKIEEIIHGNVAMLVDVCQDFHNQGLVLTIPDANDRQIRVKGFGYNTEDGRYQVCLQEAPALVVPLEGPLRLLRK